MVSQVVSQDNPIPAIAKAGRWASATPLAGPSRRRGARTMGRRPSCIVRDKPASPQDPHLWKPLVEYVSYLFASSTFDWMCTWAAFGLGGSSLEVFPKAPSPSTAKARSARVCRFKELCAELPPPRMMPALLSRSSGSSGTSRALASGRAGLLPRKTLRSGVRSNRIRRRSSKSRRCSC